MVVAQGEVYWADLPEPSGSEPGYSRPVVIVQDDRLNRTTLPTAVCCILTGNLALARARGNVLLMARLTGLPRDSVANISQIVTVDHADLRDRVGLLPRPQLELVLDGIEVMLGRK